MTILGLSGARFLKWFRRDRFLRKPLTTDEKATPGKLETESDPPEADRARLVYESRVGNPPLVSKKAEKSHTEQTEIMDQEK